VRSANGEVAWIGKSRRNKSVVVCDGLTEAIGSALEHQLPAKETGHSLSAVYSRRSILGFPMHADMFGYESRFVTLMKDNHSESPSHCSPQQGQSIALIPPSSLSHCSIGDSTAGVLDGGRALMVASFRLRSVGHEAVVKKAQLAVQVKRSGKR
jgi:hypothetical protein